MQEVRKEMSKIHTRVEEESFLAFLEGKKNLEPQFLRE